MKTQARNLTIIVCISLLLTQAAFLFIPIDFVTLYGLAFRPLVFGTLAIVTGVYMGSIRPTRKDRAANTLAALSVSLFGIVILAMAILFGAGRNAMTPNLQIVIRNLWQVGSVVIFGEYIRYKLIKGIDRENREKIIVALTIVLAFCQMDALRMFLNANISFTTFFFESFFVALVVSAAASYIALEGNFYSQLAVIFTHTIAVPYFLPILPNVPSLVWALVQGGAILATAAVFRTTLSTKQGNVSAREKRAAKYEKKSIASFAASAAIVIFAGAFFLGVFPIYPVVVLTGSMSGAFERGSIVFVERVPSGKAFTYVEEGDIIHFLSQTGVAYVHRVIDFVTDGYGQRSYITRGDASPVQDPFPVPPSHVLGIVRGQLPFVGYPYIIFRSNI
ncbi:MAG: signal peptidase I [Defluviitaleaceae bacterium]|nr:signal peptidase I [Defluviitaleaceae bacterium]MCL2262387.1 signal peptidase I [Defluviitaleaceae bacterium]